jgi:N-acetylgalactosamine kinase
MARPELAELMADSERYVGTRGGGMDQAVCLLAEEGSALLIRFFPLRTEPVNVPRDAAFVVCHSMVSAPKSREIRAAYNLRALESRLAAEILARRLGAVSEQGDVPLRLGDLISSEPDESPSDLLDKLEKISHGTPWNPEAVARTLGLSLDCLSDTWFKPFNTELDPDRPLKILERARHVLTEGERVHRASDALRRGDLEALGALMNASHESCARDYEISVPELDRLVEVARRNGAIGSRLTGAGFGGCTVSLVLKGQVEVFCRKVAEDFYGTSWVSQFHGFPDRQQEKAPPIYPCRPVPGASKIL